MKIAIFGYPRSGTTMLNNMISKHLIEAGVAESWASIGEVFNPLEGTRLLFKHPQGHLINLTDQSLDESQPREERLRLFESSDQDYIIKVLAYDLTVPGVADAVVNAGYRIIPIERRNPLSAFLSVLIAFRHQVWYTYDDNFDPQYEPFEVTEAELIGLGKSFVLYHHNRDKLTKEPVVYYEDIATQSPEDTLRQLGLYQEGTPAKESPTKKLLSFEEKAKLITNLDEVTDYLYGILTPYIITTEHNHL